MEAVQFHPTAIFPAGILVTEGCRGDGGLLLDGREHRFMPDYEPEKMELASRDVVSRRMEEHIRAGSAAANRFGDHLWLDIRLLGEAHINARLREVKEICHYFLGIDPARELIPVRPAQHYSMGGVRTDYRGESVGLRGLFAAGEAACWDIHGFNRLGGNSVAETVVAGMIVGEYMADFCDSDEGEVAFSTALVREAGARQQSCLRQLLEGTESANPYQLIRDMQNIMTEQVGIFRNQENLQSAVDQLQELLKRSTRLRLNQQSAGANPELVAGYRLPRMLKLALCVAQGALARTESRGAHYREDYVQRNDRDWLKRTLAYWPGADSITPQLHYEPLSVMNMELPPGWRGYGARDFIDHPDTARRQAEVAAIVARTPDRFARQEMLMPYKQQLPVSLRGSNARLDEGGEV
jgi:fumarate reductase flavoprotein subunit